MQTSFVDIAEASKEPNMENTNLIPSKVSKKTKTPIVVSLRKKNFNILTYTSSLIIVKKAPEIAICPSRQNLDPAIDSDTESASHIPPTTVSTAPFFEQPELTQKKQGRKRQDS